MRKNMPLKFPYNVTMQELDEFVKANPAVERWLRKYPDTTTFEYSYALARYFKWLKVVKGWDVTPKEALNDHLQCLKSEDVTLRKKHLNLAYDFTRDNPDFADHSDSRKKVLFSAISSFYAEYEVPLTSAKTSYGRVRKKYHAKQMTLDEAKRLIGSCRQREKALLLIMLQSGMSIGDVLNKFNYTWHKVKPQLEADKQRIKIEMEGRKGGAQPYFTYISRDAIQELRKYLAERGEPQEGEPIFISRVWKPLTRAVVYSALSSVYRKAGLEKKDRSYTLHMFRKLFKSEASVPDRGIDRDIVEFFMGHKGGIDAVGAEYDKTPELYENVIEREYAKLEPYINIFSAFKPIVVDKEELRKRIIATLPDEMLKPMAREYGVSVEIFRKNLRQMGRKVEKRKPPQRGKRKQAKSEADCQKIVPESELAEYLGKGWRVQAVLPSGKVVISNE